MTGPEHYRIAEKCLETLGERGPDEDSPALLAEAQVHATLALAAATALRDPEGGTLGQNNHSEWVRAASVRP